MCDLCGEGHVGICYACHERKELFSISGSGDLCYGCLMDARQTCHRCGLSFVPARPGRTICASCWPTVARECEGCGEELEGGAMQKVLKADGELGYCCYECLDKEAASCPECERIAFNAAMVSLEGEKICRRCYNALGRFLSWRRTKPRKFYGGAGGGREVYYGVELEVDGSGQSRNDAAKAVFDIAGRFLECKYDGSIDCNNGMEIASQPATIAFHKENFWGDVLDYLISKDWGASKACGLHIHASRRLLAKSDEVKIAAFTHLMPTKQRLIAGRTSKGFAALQRGRGKLRQLSCGEGGKYLAVNFENSNTIEWRLFRGTTDLMRLYAALEYVDSLIRFVKVTPGPVFLKGRGAWKRYVNFVNENGYHILHKLIKAPPKKENPKDVLDTADAESVASAEPFRSYSAQIPYRPQRDNILHNTYPGEAL